MNEFRAIAPSASRGSGPPRSPEGAPPRRRRVTGQVSQLACNECRRTRSKCDGDRPHRCGRCAARGLSCIYEPHTKTQKNDLLKELSKAHEREKSLQDRNNNSELILDIIRADGHVDEVIRKLREGETHANIVEWLRTLEDVRLQLERSPAGSDSMLEVVQRVGRIFAEPNENTLEESIAAKWTRVTANTVLLRHLFDLYFAWVHPHHYLFAEVDMLESFYSGRDTYCSEALVNAVCAMACHLLESPATSSYHMEPHDVWELRNAFVDEARSHIQPQIKMDMLTLQSMAVLALVQISQGHARSAMSYLRVAAEEVDRAELPLHGMPVPRMHKEITNVSKWGITTLSVTWRSLTYQNTSFPGPGSTDAELIGTALREQPWQMYRQKDDAIATARRPAFSALTARHQAKLAEVAANVIDLYSGHLGTIHAKQIMAIYKNFKEWRKALPEALTVHSVSASDQVLPHVCALHVWYYASLIQLWAPVVHVVPPLQPPGPSNVFTGLLENARDGIRLVEYLHRKNVTRYSMPSVAFCVCHLGETIIRYSEQLQEKIQVITLCLEVMEVNRNGFNVCGPLSQILRTNAAQEGLNIDEILPEHLNRPTDYDVDAILDCTTRLNFAQPVRAMARWLAPQVWQEWPGAWAELQEEETRLKSKPMRVTDLLNS